MTREQIIADYLGGMSAAEIALLYGRSVNGVQVSLSRWGVKLPEKERKERTIAGRWPGYCAKPEL